mmetsp:Transcript_5718/g.21685  ORF Transcript_5718/g.21685 Transcript_5718/m.21685 type:complete len:270 (+) Transcript_5718:688-1497(+)
MRQLNRAGGQHRRNGRRAECASGRRGQRAALARRVRGLEAEERRPPEARLQGLEGGDDVGQQRPPCSLPWGHFAPLLHAVVEGAKMASRATAAGRPIRARLRLVVQRVVELLLRTVRQRAGEAVGAALVVDRLSAILGPMRAGIAVIAQLWSTAPILIGVRVHARVPIVLCAIGAPQRLKRLHVVFPARLSVLDFGQQSGADLLPRVREGAAEAALARRDVRVGRTEPLLEHVRVVEELETVMAPRARVALGAVACLGVHIEALTARLR